MKSCQKDNRFSSIRSGTGRCGGRGEDVELAYRLELGAKRGAAGETYRTSVKPSARRSGAAKNCGATQKLTALFSHGVVVSSHGSPSAGLTGTLRSLHQ